MGLKTQPKEKKNNRVKYDTAKLKEKDILKTFKIQLRNRYQVLEEEAPEVEEDEEVERDSEMMEKAYVEVAEAVLGRPRKKKKPWISEKSWKLVEQRENINKEIIGTKSERIKKQLKIKYKEKDKETKRSIKLDKKKWIEDIASKAEEASKKQHMKTLYGLTKTLCNERPRQSNSVMDKRGNLINGKKAEQERWTEYFKEILNREEPINPITEEEEVELKDMIEEIDTQEPTPGEVREVIKGLQNGKAPGIDSITAELLKADIEFSTKKVHQLLQKI